MSKIISTFSIAGMTCDACQKVVSKKLGKITDVNDVSVNKNSGIAEVTAQRSISSAEVRSALAGTHYSLVE